MFWSRVLRILFPFLVLLVLTISAVAEVPEIISYQGRLTDADGNPVADGSYNLTFEIVEHDPVPMGESPLWSSGVQTVTVTDGLFVYYLGSNVALPTEIFKDDALDSYFIRIQVEGSAVFSNGTELVTTPFAVRSIYSDTADYALAGAGGGGSNGWVDDGSTVRLESSSNKVGIGVSTPTDKLVVGSTNIGSSIDDEYIVCGNGYYQGYSGLKIGFNADNFARMKWYGTGEELSFDTRSLGVFYNNTLVLKKGNVGIGQFSPSEPLVVGDDLGSFAGNRIAVGDNTPGAYTGFMTGEDSDNRAFLTWNIDNNFLGIGIEDGGSQWSNMICLRNGNVGFGTSNPTAKFHVTGSGDADVQLPTDAISASEILDEPGIASQELNSTIGLPLNVWDTLLTRTCTFPTSGYVVVLATCEVGFYIERAEVEFGISDSSGTAPHSYLFDTWGDPSGGFVAYDYRVITIHETFAVSPGVNHLSFVAKSRDGSADVRDARITVMFFPTAYGTVTKSSGMEDDTLDFTNIDTGAPSGDWVEDRVAERVRTETELIRAEFEAKLDALRQELLTVKEESR